MSELVYPGLERRLKTDLSGEVLFDRFSRGRYATDASHYQIMPVGVVAPRTIEEANRAIEIAREEGVPITPRGGGTSQCGQTINTSLIVDCSKYLDNIIELDVPGRRCVVEPGIVLDELNRRLKPHGLWFPVDISTASRATIGGMVGNNSCGARSLRYGNTRENVLSVDALLPDGSAAAFRTDRARSLRRAGGVEAAGAQSHGDRRARSGDGQGALSAGAAPGRRLQSRCARARQATT